MKRKISWLILFSLLLLVKKILSGPDVGVISITIPPEIVDSNSVVAPSAVVKNFGDTTVSFPVIFRDSNYSYIDVKQVTNLAPEATVSVNFNMWRIRLPRGTHIVKCSTALDGDIDNTNDALEKSIFCRIKDISLLELCLPDTVDSGTIITPQARIINFGNTQETFWAILKIGTFYACTLEVLSPLPETEDTLDFRLWTANMRGTHPVSCTIALAGDVNPINNFLTGELTVRIGDFGINQILAPELIIPENSPVIPKVSVTNFGSTPATSPIFFIITDPSWAVVYQDSNLITLDPTVTDTISFAIWNGGSGAYRAIAYTKLLGDINPHNDTLVQYFFAGTPNRDVGVIRIIAPTDSILRTPIAPKAEVKNLGEISENFYTFFKILSGQTSVYFESLLITNLAPNQIRTIVFPTWQPLLGDFVTKCSTALAGDMNPENNTLTGQVTVETLAIGWVRRRDFPKGPSSKPKAVKAGGALVYVPPTSIYAFKGNNTNEFYCYDIPSNTWTPKETIPWVDRKKRVKTGASLCYDNERYIYALKGNNTLEFWRYDTQKDSWAVCAQVPAGGDKPKKVKAGASLAFVTVSDTQHLIYFLKGSGTFEFYAYWVEKDTWLQKNPASGGPDNKKFKAGSCLTYDYHHQCLWTLKGGTNEFYAYDLTTGTWLEKPNINLIGRAGKKKKVKDGGAIAYSPATRSIYAIKGGNIDEFWCYTPPADSWVQLDDMPPNSDGKRVKGGGALIYAAGNLYALRGNKTFDFFIYNFGSSVGIKEPDQKNLEFKIRHSELKIYPNPFLTNTRIHYQVNDTGKKVLVTIKLYNITGQLEKVLVNDLLSPGAYTLNLNSFKLASGVYILRMTVSRQTVAQKIIIARR